MKFLTILAIFGLILSGGVFYLYEQFAPHKVLKRTATLQNHPKTIFEKVFSDSDFENLKSLAKSTTFKMTSRADAQKEFDFGSSPLSQQGHCPHSLQHTNLNKTKCIVPARIDVAKHLMMTGGWGGKKESYEKLVSRAKFFQHFWADFNPENPEIMPEVKSLFEREDYLKDARKICQGQQYLDPMQASILVGIPGQEVGLHYDTPWFYGADRNEFPLWLLVAMRTSGLYDDIAINQVQGVAYLHDWTDTDKMGGAFYFFEKGPIGEMSKVDAKPNRGLIVDGTVMSHGTQTFMPHVQPEKLDKDIDYQIKFNNKTRKWDVHELDSQKYFKSYNEDEVRITLVWRQRCFEDQKDYENFREKQQKSKQLKADQVFQNLLQNLVKRGDINEIPENQIDQITVLVDNYIRYPFPESIFPYNYCMLSKLYPSVKPLLDLIC